MVNLPPALTLARALGRAAPTPERRLWEALRAGQLAGLQFRRQAPIGPYIVDFACFKSRLVVVIEGGSVLSAAGERLRDFWLTREGYRVLRVLGREVTENLAGVLQLIQQAARGRDG